MISSSLYSIGWKFMYIWVSSAYRWYWTPCSFKISAKGNVYNENRIGPNTEPCGIPKISFWGLDFSFSIYTVCCLSLRYDLNHLSASPEIPTIFSRRSNKMLWSTVSNADDNSSSNNMVTCCLSIAFKMSFWTLTSAVSVLCPQRYADWNCSRILFCRRWSWSWTAIIRSITFDMNFKFQTGR